MDNTIVAIDVSASTNDLTHYNKFIEHVTSLYPDSTIIYWARGANIDRKKVNNDGTCPQEIIRHCDKFKGVFVLVTDGEISQVDYRICEQLIITHEFTPSKCYCYIMTSGKCEKFNMTVFSPFIVSANYSESYLFTDSEVIKYRERIIIDENVKLNRCPDLKQLTIVQIKEFINSCYVCDLLYLASRDEKVYLSDDAKEEYKKLVLSFFTYSSDYIDKYSSMIMSGECLESISDYFKTVVFPNQLLETNMSEITTIIDKWKNIDNDDANLSITDSAFSSLSNVSSQILTSSNVYHNTRDIEPVSDDMPKLFTVLTATRIHDLHKDDTPTTPNPMNMLNNKIKLMKIADSFGSIINCSASDFYNHINYRFGTNDIYIPLFTDIKLIKYTNKSLYDLFNASMGIFQFGNATEWFLLLVEIILSYKPELYVDLIKKQFIIRLNSEMVPLFTGSSVAVSLGIYQWTRLHANELCHESCVLNEYFTTENIQREACKLLNYKIMKYT